MGDAKFGEKVKVKREEKGLTQAQLAMSSGLTQATISRIESGQVTQLLSDGLKRLAAALGVTVDFLIGKKDRMEAQELLEADNTAKAIFRGYENLSEERRKDLQDYVEFLLNQQRKSAKKSPRE